MTTALDGSALRKLPLVAITGANGYLGTLLVKAFTSAGFVVRQLVRSPIKGSDDRMFELGGVSLSDSLRGADVLVHCAYDMTLKSRTDIWQTNVFGSMSLFDLAVSSGVRRSIAVSSMSAYLGTRQLYGRAKLDIEVAALDRGMTVIRPGLVYGAGQRGMAGTLQRLATLPVLPDFGSAAYQFTVNQEDFSAAVVALATTDERPPQPVGIAHPDPVGFKALLTGFGANDDRRRPPRFFSIDPRAVYAALRTAEMLSVTLPVRADSLLGLFRPAPCVPNVDVIARLGITLRPFSPCSVLVGQTTERD